jgi:hypothetical protein
MNRTDVYKLFLDEFKINDDVIIIDEDDNFIFGKIVKFEYDQGILLRKYFYPPYLKWHQWETMRFICHEGFPVRKLFPRSSDKYLVQLDTNDIVNSLRQLTVSEICVKCGKLTEGSRDNHTAITSWGDEYHCPKCYEQYRSMRGGHPFEIENVHTVVYNPGNCNHYHNYIDDRYIETMILTSRDGIVGHLWDLSTIFELEIK